MTSSATPWLRDERIEAAAERILDAAAELFVERGVATTGMAEVAKAAGCSRATLYRYFDSRRALHLAFVHREARRLGDRVAAEVAGIADPGERITEATLAAVREVRQTSTLAAWFGLGDAGIASELAGTSEVVEVLGSTFLADAGGGAELSRRSRWLVRVIVSLLTVPGADEADERAMIEQFVVPVLLAPGSGGLD
ncbi:TetR/AcrR family transcriptional regulator [Rhodococcus spelaei]|uniref:TetR/AcrR family transcriptional regulator n=1 Tax=Rhodococcus spelaei TaxID=2546320 RepID=A0A541BR56_9NOCA|nr:helix-turn-helix domain-containing protein [Rhodococcus spelaei]TQF74803.1 TetR/AcrR family transcriptional regulator [Rhodococcus spelaei]